MVAKHGHDVNRTDKPEVIHVGPRVGLYMDRYRPHFRLHCLDDATVPAGFAGLGASALIAAGPVPGALIAQLPALRLIAAYGVGTERIDRDAARARGIAVTNTPGATDGCVADMAFALLLAAARGVVAGDRFVRDGRWEGEVFPLMPRLHGRTMGILGLGRIGLAIARRAAAFDMPVLYHNRREVAGVPYGYRPSARALAADCEVLVVACPGGEATRGMVDRGVLAALGARGIVVNIARGSVIDETALIAALRDGTIAAAGLDVFETEPMVPVALRRLDNVVLMPHRGGGTVETWEDCADLVVANLRAHFAGQALPSIVA